jgi:hypothetical protein
MTTFSTSLTNLTTLLPQSHDYSCYVRRGILKHLPIWLHKHTDPRTRDFAHSPALWLQCRIAKGTSASSWCLCGITPALTTWCHTTKSTTQILTAMNIYKPPRPVLVRASPLPTTSRLFLRSIQPSTAQCFSTSGTHTTGRKRRVKRCSANLFGNYHFFHNSICEQLHALLKLFYCI